MLKTCYDCKEEKPTSEYNKNRATKDGLSQYCRQCSRRRQTVYNRLRRERRESIDKKFDPATEKKCSKCGETKPMSEFHKSYQAKDGRFPYCKACKSLVDRLYKEKKYLPKYRTLGKEQEMKDPVQAVLKNLHEAEAALQEVRDLLHPSSAPIFSYEDTLWMRAEVRAISHRISDVIDNIVEIEGGKKK